MATNIFTTRTEVADRPLRMLYVNVPQLDYIDWRYNNNFSRGQLYGQGTSQQIRKRATLFGGVIPITDGFQGQIPFTTEGIQQETITLNVDNIVFAVIDINAVNLALKTKEGGLDQEFTNPAVGNMKLGFSRIFYDSVMRYSYKTFGTSSSTLQDSQQIALLNAAMSGAQMAEERVLFINPYDAAYYMSTMGTYPTPARTIAEGSLRGTLQPIYGIDMYCDNTIKPHISGSLSTQTGLIIGTDQADGDVYAVIDGIPTDQGYTVNLFDRYQIENTGFTANSIYYVAPERGTGNIIPIDPGVLPVTYIIAEGDSNTPDWDATTNTYTSSGSSMTVKLSNPVRTDIANDKFADTYAPSDTISAGTSITFLKSYNVNFAMTRNSVYGGNPPYDLRYGLMSRHVTYEDLNYTILAQDTLIQGQRTQGCFMMFGCVPDPRQTLIFATKAGV